MIKFAVLIFCLAGILTMPNAFAQDLSSLTSLEERLFHHNYAQDSLDVRLNRLEKQVFGEIIAGTTETRIHRLVGTQVQSSVPVTSMVAEKGVLKPSLDLDEPSESYVMADEDCAIQRAQVMVKASNEAETTKLLSSAVQLFRAGKLEESREKFEQVLRIEPYNPQANFSLGIIEEGLGCLSEALSSYRKALEAHPNNAEYKDAINQVQAKMSKYAGLDSRRVQIRSLANTAMQAFSRGDYQTALNLYLTLDQKSPGQAIVKSNLATVYMALKQPEKALAYYKQAAELNPYDQRFQKAYEHVQSLVDSSFDDNLESKLDMLSAQSATTAQ